MTHGAERFTGAVWTEIDSVTVRGIPRLGKSSTATIRPNAHLDLPEIVIVPVTFVSSTEWADVFHDPPTGKIVADKRVFRMKWDDGQLTEYEWDGLRRACPWPTAPAKARSRVT